jgi:predicted nucleic acid-binding protein
MTGGSVFVDTNIVVYAYDISAGSKHSRAAEIMKELWDTGRGVISTQVLQEFFVTTTKKIEKPLDVPAARDIVKDFLKWKTVIVDGETILEAIDVQAGHQYSFWDSLIIASAIQGGAATLLSEDLSPRHKLKGLVIRNPF